MSVLKYQQKPHTGGVLYAARYQPGQPLGDLRTVAHVPDPAAELAEVVFIRSGTVLAVRWEDLNTARPVVQWTVVTAGDFLTAGPGLGTCTAGDLAKWYDPVPSTDEPQPCRQEHPAARSVIILDVPGASDAMIADSVANAAAAARDRGTVTELTAREGVMARIVPPAGPS